MIKRDEMKKILESDMLRGFLSPEASLFKFSERQMGTYTGLVMHDPQKDAAVTAVLNLDMAYQAVRDSQDEFEAAQRFADIINAFVRDTPPLQVDLDEIRELMSDYNRTVERLYMDAVSPSYNNPEVAVCEHLGMKFVPKIYLSDFSGGSSAIPVPVAWLNQQGVTMDKLFDDAVRNMSKLSPDIQLLESILNESRAGCMDFSPEMYVISGRGRMNGAGIILDQSALDKMAGIYEGRNFYILPSSVHELICILVDETFPETSDTVKGFAEMVAEVNATMEPEDIFAYDVYHFSAGTHKLAKATDYCIEKQLEVLRNYRSKDIGDTLKQPDREADRYINGNNDMIMEGRKYV